MNSDDRKVFEFIRSNKLCVLSTIGVNGSPQSALVGFSETDKFELIFSTDMSSRKYENLIKNKAVSVVIGWGDTRTVQYEGEAKLLESNKAATYKAEYFKKLPFLEKHDGTNKKYFMVRPTWIRYTDIIKTPWEVTEIIF